MTLETLCADRYSDPQEAEARQQGLRLAWKEPEPGHAVGR